MVSSLQVNSVVFVIVVTVSLIVQILTWLIQEPWKSLAMAFVLFTFLFSDFGLLTFLTD